MVSSLPSLVQYWDVSNIPAQLYARMNDWKNLNPSWNYCRFNRESAATFLGQKYSSELCDAFLDVRLPAMQADVFRVAYLNARGGVWVDAATVALKPLDTWLDRDQSLVLLRRPHQEHPKVATQLIYASHKTHPLLQEAWVRLVYSLLHRLGVKVYRDFGPGLFRDLMVENPCLSEGLQVMQVQSLQSYFQIGSSSSVITADHHWSQRQQSESLYFSGG